MSPTAPRGDVGRRAHHGYGKALIAEPDGQREAGGPRTAGNAENLITRTSPVKAAKQPDQQDDRDRNSDQPQQETSSHRRLLFDFNCDENAGTE